MTVCGRRLAAVACSNCFTPAVVAFDAAEYPELGLGRRPPTRLLALGERLLLFGSAVKGNDAYPLLASDDQGVSFRTP